jgi:quercetin dioxygenase-like cupin family protein
MKNTVHQTHLALGAAGAFGILYRFDKRGQGLPMHSHPSETAHDVLCTGGTIAIILDGGISIRVPAGTLAKLENDQHRHEIVALEDGSSCINIFHNGRPGAYDALAPAERDSTVELRPLELSPFTNPTNLN